MSARIDPSDSLTVSPKLNVHISLPIWVNVCIENQRSLQIKANNNKAVKQQKEINNLMFLEEIILIIQNEIIFRNLQNYLREKLRDEIQVLEAKVAEEQQSKNIQNQNYTQQLLQNQKLLQSLQNEYQKTISELSSMRARLNDQLLYLNNKIDQYQEGINKLNTRLDNNLNRLISDYNAQVIQREYRVGGNVVNVNVDNIFNKISNAAFDKYKKNESFDFEELSKDKIREDLYESLGAKVTYLDQNGLNDIENITNDAYANFQDFIHTHGNGQTFLRDLEIRDRALDRLESLELQRDNIVDLIQRVDTTATAVVENLSQESDDITEAQSKSEDVNNIVSELKNDYSQILESSQQNADDDEFAALLGDLDDPAPAEPNDYLENQQAAPSEPEPENIEEEPPENQPAPPGGISIADIAAAPPGGPEIQIEEPEIEPAPDQAPELPASENEIKSQPEDVKPKSSTLAALSKLGISKEQVLEKKESDKKEEEAKKAEQQPHAKDLSQESSQRKPDAPDQSGPKFGR